MDLEKEYALSRNRDQKPKIETFYDPYILTDEQADRFLRYSYIFPNSQARPKDKQPDINNQSSQRSEEPKAPNDSSVPDYPRFDSLTDELKSYLDGDDRQFRTEVDTQAIITHNRFGS